ncbi:MAG: tetratricopeptide repeat protein [Holosporaceae bacterium]|jgi:TolA-binding protein|nr:tetratricopeptide repeat protein [Holosporaceae bacterium]
MKKVIYSLLLTIFISEIYGKDSDMEDLSDTVRNLTGKVEELEKTVQEQGKRLEELDEKNKQREENQSEFGTIPDKSPEDVIKTACDLLDQNEIEKGRKMLDAFIAKNPTNIYCGMMLFYVGNSYFMEKDYKNAALAYMKGFKANPAGCKAAETLYKLAICFRRLGEKEKWKSTLEKIISDYPGEFARKASLELKKNK